MNGRRGHRAPCFGERDIITSQQYEEAVKERQAAGAVELALDEAWTRKKAVLAELKQALARGH